MNDYFFNNAPECFVVISYEGKVLFSNQKMQEIFGADVERGKNLGAINFKNDSTTNLFDQSLNEGYFEFDFENREISYLNKNGYLMHFLLSSKRIEAEGGPCLFLSFKNITDFVGYKNIFEDLYNNLSTKTIELDRVISEKEKAYKLLKQKDNEMYRQLNLAREIQTSLFPDVNICVGDFEIASSLNAASLVSGDVFSIWNQDKRSVDILIADVTGHGVPSAFITMLLKMSLQTTLRTWGSPKDIVSQLNNDMNSILSNAAIFVTLLYTRINLETGVTEIINCGHPPPIILRKSGEIEMPDVNGMMLGVVEELDYGTTTINIDKGDNIYFITDGILEAQDMDENFFDSIFFDFIKSHHHLSPDKLIESIKSELHRFTGSEEYQDDTTIIIAKRVEGKGSL